MRRLSTLKTALRFVFSLEFVQIECHRYRQVERFRADYSRTIPSDCEEPSGISFASVRHSLRSLSSNQYVLDPFGYTKTSICLYDLLQEFLKGKTNDDDRSIDERLLLARWHIALVRDDEDENEKNANAAIAGIITLEDVIEEMLQREIIEEADFFSENLEYAG